MLVSLFGLAGVLAVAFFTMEQGVLIKDLQSHVGNLEADVASLKTSRASLCSSVGFI